MSGILTMLDLSLHVLFYIIAKWRVRIILKMDNGSPENKTFCKCAQNYCRPSNLDKYSPEKLL